MLILGEVLAKEGQAFLIVEGNGDLVFGVFAEVDDPQDTVEESNWVVLLVEDVEIYPRKV